MQKAVVRTPESSCLHNGLLSRNRGKVPLRQGDRPAGRRQGPAYRRSESLGPTALALSTLASRRGLDFTSSNTGVLASRCSGPVGFSQAFRTRASLAQVETYKSRPRSNQTEKDHIQTWKRSRRENSGAGNARSRFPHPAGAFRGRALKVLAFKRA